MSIEDIVLNYYGVEDDNSNCYINFYMQLLLNFNFLSFLLFLCLYTFVVLASYSDTKHILLAIIQLVLNHNIIIYAYM